jgi:hypothetical protein
LSTDGRPLQLDNRRLGQTMVVVVVMATTTTTTTTTMTAMA